MMNSVFPTAVPNGHKLSGARVMITGGAGLIGSHIIDRLLATDVTEIVVIDNLSRGRLVTLSHVMTDPRLKFIEGDIRDRTILGSAFAGIDLLIHLAAIRLTHAAEVPRLGLEVMADGTYNVLEAAIAEKIPRVVAASSASVYGMADTFPISEDHHPYNNDTIYGAAKAFNEGLLASFRAMYGLNYVALRPFNVYGPRMDVHGAYTEVLVRWMDRIKVGKPPLIFGDGKQSMDFVYVEDVARAFVIAATSDVNGGVFNVATGVETTLKELALALLRVMGSNLVPEYGPPRAVTTVARRIGDPRRAAEQLGFRTEVSLAEGLARLVKWWRESIQTPAL